MTPSIRVRIRVTDQGENRSKSPQGVVQNTLKYLSPLEPSLSVRRLDRWRRQKRLLVAVPILNEGRASREKDLFLQHGPFDYTCIEFR